MFKIRTFADILLYFLNRYTMKPVPASLYIALHCAYIKKSSGFRRINRKNDMQRKY